MSEETWQPPQLSAGEHKAGKAIVALFWRVIPAEVMHELVVGIMPIMAEVERDKLSRERVVKYVVDLLEAGA